MDAAILTLQRAAQAADDRWSTELARTFGTRAGDARYTQSGMGAPGTPLRQAYYGYMAARLEWHAAIGWSK